MKYYILLFIFLLSAVAVSAQSERFVAVTIDDLPVVVKNGNLKLRQKITRRLLGHVKKKKVPAIGFVNEGKLYRDGKLSEAEVDLLRQWLAAGLELGNHTYSHLSLHRNPLEKYTAEILQGEIVTKKLLSEKGLPMRYFRHPYLNTGLDLEIKQGLDAFLAEHDYTIAPVTIDTSDWIFARAYDNAVEKNDKKLKKEIGKAYVPYIEAKTKYWEEQSKRLFGREIRQILLIHANSINAEYFGDVAEMYRKRGYEFVTLEEALKDGAYELPDTYTRNAGISWLHRWAWAKGRETIVADEPAVPEFVMKAAGVDSE